MSIHRKLNTGSTFDLNNTESGCCPDTGTTCRYHYVFDDDGTTLTSIVVDGVTVALDAIDPTGSLSDLITALHAKLKAAGFTYDGNKSITAWRGADTLNINFVSTVVFGDLVTSGGTITATANCIQAPLCYYELEAEVGAGLVMELMFGKPGDLDGATVTGDYLTGSGDTLAADVITALDGVAHAGTLIQATRVKVVENIGAGLYSIGIWLYRAEGGNLYLDGELITPFTCDPSYSKA